ncbi:MAG: aminotransferase class I/II-fold pyridoxal phosphate-dependent enzyme [Candidatus Riflebacteria bacterium]|nr:aminotransferase class I/II-fold pyridoxal phosphate-dependent enzyme [Candidatus Riflebacteria bacterium]
MKKHGFDTLALHAGGGSFLPDAMSVPIYQSVAYPFEDAVEAAAISNAEKPGFTYGRWDNPTVQVFEQRMAALEGAEAAIATSSGMAATFLLAHHLVKAGEEVVSSNRVYGGTFGLFDTGLQRMGAKVRWITNPESLDAWADAITPNTRFLFVESPSNPGLFIGDIRKLAKLAHSKGIPLVADNTICTPALQRPIELGADIVVHSTTKYINGNASALGGIVIGSRQLIDDIRKVPMRYLGPSMSPFNAWLNLNSLETLSLRMARHCHNAMAVAKFLTTHPAVESVNYPGLPSNPYHKLAEAQMKGCSSLLSFVIKGSYDDAVKVIDSFELWTHATHLGTCKTIVTHPASTTHAAMGPEELKKAGIPASLIRVSVGIEDTDDIIADVEQALAKLKIGRKK